MKPNVQTFDQAMAEIEAERVAMELRDDASARKGMLLALVICLAFWGLFLGWVFWRMPEAKPAPVTTHKISMP